MKVGDLVTLSSYGKRLRYVASAMAARRWKHDTFREKPLIGLVVAKRKPTYSWQSQEVFEVSWIDNCEDNPLGRDDYTKSFQRRDLKLVNKAK
tara:strand:- start:198 stop:476 length:279 start_codon:yes stop_codon:yes gene_type:complete